MFRTKSRRNIRSKRVLSRKNRSRKNRNSRRMKGGNPSTDKAIKLNSIILCTYEKLLNKHRAGIIDEKSLKERAAELMLYQIKISKEHPNPMSIADIIDTHNTDIQFLYIDDRVNCSGTVI